MIKLAGDMLTVTFNIHKELLYIVRTLHISMHD